MKKRMLLDDRDVQKILDAGDQSTKRETEKPVPK